MKALKKSLSIVLVIAMMFTSLCFFPADFSSLGLKAEAAVPSKGDLAFYVPEAIYLYPEVTSWKADTSTPFQYYINNTVDVNDIFKIPTPSSAAEKSSKVYFALRNGVSGAPSLSYKFINKSGAALTGGSVAKSALNAVNGYYVADITGGSSPSIAAADSGCYIEWTVTYNTADGKSQTVKAYTYVYKPYVLPVGGALRTTNAAGTNDQYLQHVLWFSGVHGFTHGSTAADKQKPVFRSPTFDNGPNSDAGMMGFLSKEKTGYISGSAVTTTANAITASDMFAVFGGTTNFDLSLNNTACERLLSGKNDSPQTPETFSYLNQERNGYSDHCVQTLYSKAFSSLNIDISRYNNLNQVPNLGIGMYFTEDKGNDTMNWYIADYTGRTTYKNTDGANGRKNLLHGKIDGHCKNVFNDKGSFIMYLNQNFANYPGKGNTDGLRYTNTWNKAIDGSKADAVYSIKSYHGGIQGSDHAHAFIILDLNAKQTNKSALRTAVDNARNEFSTFGVTGDWGSHYYDVNSPAWQAFKNAYIAADKGLTIVDGGADAATLAANLNKAVTDLKNGIGLLVHLHANGGTVSKTPVTMTAATYGNLETPKKTGYTFAGWCLDSACTNVINSSTAVSLADLYAKWTPNTYNLVFNGDSGTTGSMPEQTVTYDVSTAINQNAFVKTGCTFAGWATAPGGAKVYNDKQSIKNLASAQGAKVNLYAVWTENTYTVNYEAGGGQGTTASQSGKKYTETFTLTPNGFTRTGYTFAGWKGSDGKTYQNSASVSKLTSDANGVVTMTAQWTPNKYAVTLDNQGADINKGSASAEATFDAALPSITAPQKTGYQFLGYFTEVKGGGTKFYSNDGTSANNWNIAGNKTLYAAWAANTYTVNFDGNLNTAGTMKDQKLAYDAAVKLDANKFTKTGYKFAGWLAPDGKVYKDGDTVKNLASADGAVVTLKAQWQLVTYTVKFNANGGEGTMNSFTTDYEQTKVLEANKFTRTGYTFRGWATAADGAPQYFDKGSLSKVASDITLYAVWAANTYNINPEPYNGTTAALIMAEYDKEITIANPVKEGYTFKGWAENENGVVKYPAASGGVKVKNLTANANETVTLHAIWEINTYKVTFDYKGTLTEENVTYGGEAHPPFVEEYVKVDARNHEHFTGWDKEYKNIKSDITVKAVITTEAHSLYLKDKTEPTCTANGKQTEVCKFCGFERTTNIAAQGHKYKDVPAVPATCTKDGNIAYKLCTVCNEKHSSTAAPFDTKVLTDAEVTLKATGHNFSTEKTEANLTRPVKENGVWKDGYYTFTCLNNCGETKKEAVKRADYTEYDAAYAQLQSLIDIDLTLEAKAAVNKALKDNKQPDNLIVTEQDKLTKAAVNLNKAYNDNKDKFNAYNVTFMVDGVQYGEVQRVIRGGSAVMPEVNPTKAYDKTNHYEFTSWDNDGKNITADRTINAQFRAVKHTYKENVELLPTCTLDGLKRFTCTCGYNYTEAIPATGHNFEKTKTEENLTRPVFKDGAWIDGYYTYNCLNKCGETMTEKVSRADYTAYDKAVKALNDILKLDLTDKAKAAVNEALRINKAADNLIVTEQDMLTVPTANLENAYNTYKDALNVYTVTFMNEGVKFSETTVISGQNAAMPEAVPAKDYDNNYHYVFKSWDNNGKAITADTVINAQFDAVEHIYTSKVFPEPTCLGKGTKTYTCDCGHFYTEEVAPLGHDFNKTKSEANLTRPVLKGDTWTDGFYTYTCKRDASHKDYEFVKRADYTAYELVRSNLTALVNSGALTADALKKVNAALDSNVARNDFIATEQPELDAITAKLQVVFDANKDQVKTYTVTFKWHGGEDVQTVVINNGASAPADPAVYFDAENHYTFKNWDNTFDKITQNITVNAIYTSALHSYKYEYVNNNYHKVSCSCGYTFNENHMGGAANCTDYAVCDKCLHTYGDLIPDAHDYDKTKSEENLTRPVFENGVWTDGFYTFKCTRNPAHTTTENVARADYKAYDAAVAKLNDILKLDLTDEAKAAINKALTENEVADNLIVAEQDNLTAPTANLENAYNTYKDALKVYTVTFMNGTVTFKTVQVTSGENAAMPTEIPAKAYDETYHYTFKAWDNDGRAVTADRTINAEFTAEAHKYTSVINPAPTCEATGTETFTCPCGHSYTVTLDASGHDWDRANGVLTRPVYENGAWTEGYYTYTCKRDSAHTMTENVKRAVYTEYEAAAEKLNNLLSADLTAEAKTAIEKAIADNNIPDDRIASEQSVVDTARDNLLSVYEQYKGALKTYKVTFKWNGGETIVDVISGEDAIAPADPAKYYDKDNHYTFTAWDNTFTNIKADTVINAQYSAEAHSFTYEYKDEANHTAICACGYSHDEAHTGGTANCQSPAVCEICKHAYGSKDMTNHAGTETYIKGAVDATCEGKGYTGDTYYKCCDTLKEKGTETPATGHNWDAGKVITVPTCTTEGVKRYTCQNDSSHTKDEAIPVDENAHVWDEGTVTTPATSKTPGVITYTCKNNPAHTKTENFNAPAGITIPDVPADGTFDKDADETGKAGNIGDIVNVEPGTDVEFEIKNPEIAELDKDGNIIAKGDGNVTVVIKTPDGKFSEEIVITVRTVKTIKFIMNGKENVQKLYNGDKAVPPTVESYTDSSMFSHQFKYWTKENVKAENFTVYGNAVYTAVYTMPADYREFDLLAGNLKDILDGGLADDSVVNANQLKINTVLSHIDEINGGKLTRDESKQSEVDKVTAEISDLIDILYPDMGASLEIRAKASYYTGHTITDIKAFKMPLNVEAKDVTWTTSDESIMFYSNGKFYAVGTGEVTVTAHKGRLKDSVKIEIVVGGNMRTVRFSCMSKMQYVVEDYFAVFKGANFFWSNDEALHFRTYVYSNFGFETYIVYINGVEAVPDANGYYTVPAGSGDVTVSITGGSFDQDKPGHKLSFWEMLLAFFRRIIEFFKGLFK